jgi:hypothetical protein
MTLAETARILIRGDRVLSSRPAGRKLAISQVQRHAKRGARCSDAKRRGDLLTGMRGLLLSTDPLEQVATRYAESPRGLAMGVFRRRAAGAEPRRRRSMSRARLEASWSNQA